jgi:hypothetical protein
MNEKDDLIFKILLIICPLFILLMGGLILLAELKK